MVSFEIFVKAMPPSLSELKVLPSFCFACKIPDDRAASNDYLCADYVVLTGGQMTNLVLNFEYCFRYLCFLKEEKQHWQNLSNFENKTAFRKRTKF